MNKENKRIEVSTILRHYRKDGKNFDDWVKLDDIKKWFEVEVYVSKEQNYYINKNNYCTECGCKYDEEDNFCNNCGNKIIMNTE